MNSARAYIGHFEEDARRSDTHGWIVGTFMNGGSPQQTDVVEIKVWEFEVGLSAHATKTSATFECTFILEGDIDGIVDDEEVRLVAGQYVVIPPGIVNGFPKNVYKRVRGLTIKAPSDPTAKKIIST